MRSSRESLIQYRTFWILNTVLMVTLAAPEFTYVLFIALFAYLFRGPAEVIHALALTWLLLFLNHELFPPSSGISALRWLILAGAAIRMVYDFITNRASLPSSAAAVLLYSVIVFAGALLVSYETTVSIFKIIAFASGSLTILLAFQTQIGREDYWISSFITLALVVIGWSIPLFFIPSIGGAINGTFQGVLNQPQALGVFLAPVVAWATTKVFTAQRSVLVWFIAVSGWMSLAASASRTGLSATVLGIGTAVLISTWRRADFRHAIAKPATWAVLAVVVPALLILAPKVVGFTLEFFAKGGDTQIGSETFHVSRGMLVDASVRNFQAHPLLGIGFGMASDPALLDISRDEWFGLPIGASIEKGFLPTGVLEETGIVGALAFCLLLITIVRARMRSVAGLALVLAYLFTNFGEATFLSLGGMGLYGWLLIGLSGVIGQQIVTGNDDVASQSQLGQLPRSALHHKDRLPQNPTLTRHAPASDGRS